MLPCSPTRYGSMVHHQGSAFGCDAMAWPCALGCVMGWGRGAAKSQGRSVELRPPPRRLEVVPCLRPVHLSVMRVGKEEQRVRERRLTGRLAWSIILTTLNSLCVVMAWCREFTIINGVRRCTRRLCHRASIRALREEVGTRCKARS